MAEKVALQLVTLGGKTAVNELKMVSNGVANVGNKTKSTEAPIQKFRAGWLAASVAVAAAGAAFGKLISVASALQETTSKFNTVFTGHLDEANKSVNTLVTSYAMSTEEARRYLSAVQDLLVPMGMSSDQATKLSDGVVKLSADLGSFNNLPTEKVMLDIQSALVGNFETMKKYGVVLNENRIRQEAVNAGIEVGTGVIDANVKAGLAFKIMVEGNQAALGDMVRTSEGYANSLKNMQSKFSDLIALMGTAFLPVATAVVQHIAEMIEKIIFMSEVIGSLGAVVGKFMVRDFLGAFESAKEALTLFQQKAEEVNERVTTVVKKNSQKQIQDFKKLTKSILGNLKIQTNGKAAALKIQKADDEKAKKQEADREKNLADVKRTVWKNTGNSFMELGQVLGNEFKAVFRIGQAAAIADTTINMWKGATAAIASMAGAGPPGWIAGGIQAAAIITGGIASIAKISSTQLEMGGIIPGSIGGTNFTAGEKGKAEAIVPLEGEGAERLRDNLGGGGGVTINIENVIAENFAETIDEQLEDLRRRQSSSFAVGLETQLATT